jgi:anthranilate synthase/aminodeoxychorismate synthase-like glutamine amidotransferase
MLLLVDNYDSFVHNLARYFERLGQETHVVRNDAIDVTGVRRLRADAVILSPGPCTPREAGASLEIVRELFTEIPILGVCLGHQAIAEGLGGHVVRAPQPVHGRSTRITHNGVGLFNRVASPLTVGRYHSLVVDPESLPAQLRPTAWTEDGVLMAFEHEVYPVFGVQFHPESILTECGYDLLTNFLTLAGIDLEGRGDDARHELVPHKPYAAPLPTRPVTF